MSSPIASRKDLSPAALAALGMCPPIAVAATLIHGVLLAGWIILIALGTMGVLTLVKQFVRPQFRFVTTIICSGGITVALHQLACAFVPEIIDPIQLYLLLAPAFLPVLVCSQALMASDGQQRRILPILRITLVCGIGICLVGGIREVCGSGTIWSLAVMKKAPLPWVNSSAGALAIAAGIAGIMLAFDTVTKQKSQQGESA